LAYSLFFWNPLLDSFFERTVVWFFLFIFRHEGYKVKDSKVFFVDWNAGRGMKEILLNADAKTFKDLGGNYAKDKTRVFFAGRVIESADPESFLQIQVDTSKVENVFSKDKNYVFQYEHILKHADPQTFVTLAHGYTKDKNYVYHSLSIVDQADAETFVMLEKLDPVTGAVAKDKNNRFDVLGKKI
jgi:hypothetical protein